MNKRPWWLVPIANNREQVRVYQKRSIARLFAYAKAAWYDLLNRLFPTNCGYACAWVYPYGFVPEAGCPQHD